MVTHETAAVGLAGNIDPGNIDAEGAYHVVQDSGREFDLLVRQYQNRL